MTIAAAWRHPTPEVKRRGRGRPPPVPDSDVEETANGVADVMRVDGMIIIEWGTLDDRIVMTPRQARRSKSIFSAEVQRLLDRVLLP